MRNVINMEAIPPAKMAQAARDYKRANSPVYHYLLQSAGLGVAESWIEALAWQAPPSDDLSRLVIAEQKPATGGWDLYATSSSERIAQRNRA